MSSEQEKSLSPVNTLPVEVDLVDSGVAAWSTVIGGFLTTAATFGYANSFGVYQDIYTRSHAASASAVSWIGSTQLFFLFSTVLPGGKLLDMGYFRITGLVGSLIYGLGMGIGAGLLYVPSVAIQAHHWRNHRALAMGIVVTGSSFGGIVFPIMLNQLFKSSAGFQWGVRTSAFIVLGMLVLANRLMKAKPRSPAAERPKMNLREIMTDKPYLVCIFSVFVIEWGIFFPFFYFQLFAVLHGINPLTAFYCVAILNAGSIPGRIISSRLADYFGAYNVGVPCVTACGALIFAMTGVKTVTGMIVLAILYGFVSGAVLALTAPAFAALSRHPSEVGIRFGIAYSLSAFGALMGNPIDGALLGETFPWIKPITFSGVSVLIGAIGLVVTRQMLVRRNGTQMV